MHMMTSDKSTDFTVKFGGKLSEVNVNTLLKSLASISTVIDEISNEIGEGQKLEVKIKALDSGSFLIHIGLISLKAIDLIKQTDWGLASAVLKSLVDIFTLRKFLKGEKPKRVREQEDNVIVETKSGNEIRIEKKTFNLYNCNVRINEAISDNFEALKSNSAIDSFEIEDRKKRTLFCVPNDEFEVMSAKGITEIPDEKSKLITEPASLHIVKLVWDKTRKWEFYYRGEKISAIINDDSFFQQIDKGEQFSKGDSLEVELQIKKIFDETVNTFINKSYLVSKVLKHIPRPPQGTLDL